MPRFKRDDKVVVVNGYMEGICGIVLANDVGAELPILVQLEHCDRFDDAKVCFANSELEPTTVKFQIPNEHGELVMV